MTVHPRRKEGNKMKTPTVLMAKVWGGWYVQGTKCSMSRIFVPGTILAAVVGNVLSPLENLAELNT